MNALRECLVSSIILCGLLPLYSQCDSAFIEAREEMYLNEDSYEVRIKIVLENAELFHDCGSLEKYIDWSWSKIYVARKEKELSDQYKYLQEMDELLEIYNDSLSLESIIKNRLRTTKEWVNYYNKVSYSNKLLALRKSRRKYLNIPLDNFSDNTLKKIEREYREIADICLVQFQYSEAILNYEFALKYIGALKDKRSRLSRSTLILGRLFDLYLEINDYESAEEVLRKYVLQANELLSIDERLTSHFFYAHLRMANWHITKENIDSANYHNEKVGNLLSKYTINPYDFYLQKAKLIYLNKGTPEALIYLDKSTVKILNRIVDLDTFNFRELIQMANLHIDIKSFTEANELLEKAENILLNDPKFEINLNRNEFTKDHRNFFKLLQCQLLLPSDKNIQERKHKTHQAFDLVRKGITYSPNLADKMRFAEFSFNISSGYLDLVSNLGEDYIDEVLFSMESSKATNSIKSWANNQLTHMAKDDDLFAAEQLAQNSIHQIENEILTETDTIKINEGHKMLSHYVYKLDSIKQLLKQKHLAYYNMKYDWKIPTISNIQSVLNSDETFINYFSGEEKVYALVISKDQTEVKTLCASKKMNGLLKEYTKNINDVANTYSERKENSAISKEIYQKLIEPIAHLLKDRIIISPSGALNQLPFAALEQNDLSKNANSPKNYLVFSHAISYTPSGSFLYQQRLNKSDQKIRSSLLVAPSFGETTDTVGELTAKRSGLGPLYFNVDEVNKVYSLTKSEILTGNNATKSKIVQRLENKDLIHFSTHAKSNLDAPDKSFIAFYSTPESEEFDTSRLYLDELSKMNLNSKMIVLSACETGLGKIYKGEGAMSLSNACFYAGAQSVVATLWSILGKPSSFIMDDFYLHLEKGLTKDKALQLAQISYLDKYSGSSATPYNWSGFSVIGNSDKVVFISPRARGVYIGLIALGLILISSFLYFFSKKR